MTESVTTRACPECGSPMPKGVCPVCGSGGQSSILDSISRMELELKKTRAAPDEGEKLPDMVDLRQQLARLEARPDEAEEMRMLGTIRHAMRQLDTTMAEAEQRRRAMQEWEQQLALVEHGLAEREEVVREHSRRHDALKERESAVERRERTARDLVQSIALGKDFDDSGKLLARIGKYESSLEETTRLLQEERALFQKWLHKLEMQQQDMVEALARFSRVTRELDQEKERLGGRLAQINVLSQQLQIIRSRTKAMPKEDRERLSRLQEKERAMGETEQRLNAYRLELEENGKMQEKYRDELNGREKLLRDNEAKRGPRAENDDKPDKEAKEKGLFRRYKK